MQVHEDIQDEGDNPDVDAIEAASGGNGQDEEGLADAVDPNRTQDSGDNRDFEREALEHLRVYRKNCGLTPLSEDEERAMLENPEREALRCVRAYQERCGLPVLAEEEEKAILHWIVQGGRVPDALQLEQRTELPAEHRAGFGYYLMAQFYLLIAIAKANGKKLPVQDMPNFGATFALVATERIRSKKRQDRVLVRLENVQAVADWERQQDERPVIEDPDTVVVIITHRVTLTMDSPHELRQ